MMSLRMRSMKFIPIFMTLETFMKTNSQISHNFNVLYFQKQFVNFVKIKS